MEGKVIAEKTAILEKKTANLTRSQRLQLRNEIILAKLTTGEATRESLCQEFNISDRTLRVIIQEAREGLQEWFTDLPKNGMIAIFRANIFSVYKEIKNIEDLRSSATTPQEKLEISKALINARIQLNKLVSEGPTYQRIKDLVKGFESES